MNYAGNSFGQNLKIGDGFVAINPEQPRKSSLSLNENMNQTERGRPFILPGFNVDPEAGKIKTIWTPDQSDEIRRLTTLLRFDIFLRLVKLKLTRHQSEKLILGIISIVLQIRDACLILKIFFIINCQIKIKLVTFL